MAKEKEFETICDQCKNKYIAKSARQRFCSNKCSSQWWRDNGVHLVDETCRFCGKIFKTNSYHPTNYCSKECANHGFNSKRFSYLYDKDYTANNKNDTEPIIYVHSIIKEGKEIMIGIGDYDAKARNTRKVRTREGQLFFNGKKYAQDKKTGYYVCTTGDRKRLHVAMWEAVNGPVPEGCVIHHKDWNKTHNEISNFAMVTVAEHNLIHNRPSKPTAEEQKLLDKLKEQGLI